PVVVVDVAPDLAARVAAFSPADGATIRPLTLDVTDEDRIADLPALLGDWWRDLGIVVNNAGISPKIDGLRPPVERTATDLWRRVIEVNLTGAFLISRACIPALRSRGCGRIVMMGSQAG